MPWQKLRLDGVYKMNEAGELMLRVKVPAGVLSAEQAFKVADLAERFAGGMVHLTVRGSIELHRLVLDDLPEALRLLAAVGLTSRGACGGAVRGVACSTTFGDNFPLAQVLARKLHRHFAGNPHFEALPKKFKIGVDGGYGGSRHLIQDAGLVYVGTEDGRDLYDFWLAGGLGREPQAGFRYAERLPEAGIVPLIEAVLRLYSRHAPKGKRLKHVLREMGESTFRRLLETERLQGPAEFEVGDVVAKRLTALPGAIVEAKVFAGELAASSLRTFARIAAGHTEGWLALTADQNVAFLVEEAEEAEEVRESLAAAGFAGDTPGERLRCRVCPGSHDCRMGLAPTRDLARRLTEELGPAGRESTWAISGCLNSCSQPQLADFGIATVKNVPGPDGVRRPLFDLYRRQGEGLGEAVARGMGLEELFATIREV